MLLRAAAFPSPLQLGPGAARPFFPAPLGCVCVYRARRAPGAPSSLPPVSLSEPLAVPNAVRAFVGVEKRSVCVCAHTHTSVVKLESPRLGVVM